LSPRLPEIESLARQAGDILRAGFRGKLHVAAKSTSIDLVTEMDARAEDFIIGVIRRDYPDHAIVAEESGAHSGSAGHTWYIDPLDGTVNYAHGIPLYAVSIAYARGGVVELGAIYDPSQDECFSAARGCGAWVNGQPLHAAHAAGLSAALLVTGFPYNIRTNPRNNLDHYARFSLRSQGVRRLGSAALDLCYVAAGRFDGYWELEVKAWDIAAGALIAAEAGAQVSAVDGSPLDWGGRVSVLAAHPALHAEMLALLSAAQ
jgi:myo-inositol-1(or 4)-monophosphatase